MISAQFLLWRSWSWSWCHEFKYFKLLLCQWTKSLNGGIVVGRLFFVKWLVSDRPFLFVMETCLMNYVETSFGLHFVRKNVKYLKPLDISNQILGISPFRDYTFSYTLRFESVGKLISPCGTHWNNMKAWIRD